MTITTIGLDLAKSVFQAHGVDENGDAVVVKRLHRKQMLPFFSKLSPCLIGVEACGTAHYWARMLGTGRCDCSTRRMISSFSEAGYLMPRLPHPRSCFF